MAVPDLAPLWLSLRVSVVAKKIKIITGLPLAWVLARHEFRGKELLAGLTALPQVLPPTEMGYYQLVA